MIRITICFCAMGVAAAFCFSLVRGEEAEKKKEERIFELRTYVAAPGKLDALNARFRNHTNKLFQKHGMELVGYWTPLDGEDAKNTLIYILAYPNREAAKKSWASFSADPEWQKVRAETEKDGKMLASPPKSIYMKPTDYSPMK
jgi:hypothetical protein